MSWLAICPVNIIFDDIFLKNSQYLKYPYGFPTKIQRKYGCVWRTYSTALKRAITPLDSSGRATNIRTSSSTRSPISLRARAMLRRQVGVRSIPLTILYIFDSGTLYIVRRYLSVDSDKHITASAIRYIACSVL